MPDAKGLLSRWSRLKRAERHPPEPLDPGPGEDADVGAPEDLPPIESLGPGSDYTVFLQRNVPAALRRAALRQAWSSNPAIAQHKPLVDYDWDFHAPGYGKLWPGDDPARFLAGLFAPTRKADRDAEEAAEASGDPISEGHAEAPSESAETASGAPAQPLGPSSSKNIRSASPSRSSN